MTTCVLDVAFTFEVNKLEEAEATENHCRAAFVCVSAKHFTVGPKMAEMRVVSRLWQGPLSVPAPHEVSARSWFSLLDDLSSTQKTVFKNRNEMALNPQIEDLHQNHANNAFEDILLLGLF